MKTVELAIKPHLDAVTVRAGDTLIVRVPGATEEQARQVVEYVTANLPGVNTLVLRAEQILVFRPDGGE